MIAPGTSIKKYKSQITNFIEQNNPVIISVNFVPNEYKVDFAFYSNNKRFSKINNHVCKTIITSNLIDGSADYTIDYNSLSGAFNQGCNSLIMVLKLLKGMDVKSITLAGADGYSEEGDNYYSSNIRSYSEHGNRFNVAVSEAIHNLDVKVDFLTPSKYNII